MITDEDFRRIAAEVKANSAKLQGCAGHRFTLPDEGVDAVILTRIKVTCSACGGKMELHEAQLYMDGVLAHRKDPSLAIDALRFGAALEEAWKQRKAKRAGMTDADTDTDIDLAIGQLGSAITKIAHLRTRLTPEEAWELCALARTLHKHMQRAWTRIGTPSPEEAARALAALEELRRTNDEREHGGDPALFDESPQPAALPDHDCG